MALIVYVRQFTNPLGQLAQSATVFQLASATGGRVFEFLEAEELSDESHKQVAPAEVHGKVEFRDVRCGYDSGHETIHGITASVQLGQKVGIVGSICTGKTT
ncbi:MAG: hypothetical protein Q3974_08325 [Rothia sp. (in: high G+C Gram-positive bacteria)]|nr:hypothetical protein [Rothia sp. (in: high G+C Gram-positive bacteria)]